MCGCVLRHDEKVSVLYGISFCEMSCVVGVVLLLVFVVVVVGSSLILIFYIVLPLVLTLHPIIFLASFRNCFFLLLRFDFFFSHCFGHGVIQCIIRSCAKKEREKTAYRTVAWKHSVT